MKKINLFWLRRDLRLEDNHGLYQALQGGLPVQLVFIFDTHILSGLESPQDRRVQFIHDRLLALQSQILPLGATLDIRMGDPTQVWRQLILDYPISTVYFNEDYEPYARNRDATIKKILTENQITCKSFKDQVIFSPQEIIKKDGSPYTVFTPYFKVWSASILPNSYHSYPSEKKLDRLIPKAALPIPGLASLGFRATTPVDGPFPLPQAIIENYDTTRDTPGIQGTSRLGIHLRFGSISIRKLAALAAQTNATYLKELVWREFYQMILFYFPQTQTQCFQRVYDHIEWRNDPKEFKKWIAGETGYPLVDAGMRELQKTGFMHNRVRMVTASFLCKHLLIDWRWGEAYFASTLLDYESASNIGGWQWCAGTGNDAAPYFRIFNPTLQQKKFDPQGHYIQQWIPEYGGFGYPAPMVDHVMARERCLAAYRKARDTHF